MTLPSPMKNIVQTTESLMSSVLTVWFLIGSMIMVLMHGTEGKQREPTECNQHGDGCWDNKSFIPQKCLAIFLEIMVCLPVLALAITSIHFLLPTLGGRKSTQS